ncbi:unnamed protein product [Mytilus edulis]|uniref:Uncharacterized protein n=1 Tax=Mytilus edulis TaxID=6550 RepID=A0A8S3RR11_MYTED|nr:unnamed protein product [Mytilus edulis]
MEVYRHREIRNNNRRLVQRFWTSNKKISILVDEKSKSMNKRNTSSGVNGKAGLVVDGQVWGPLDTGIEEPNISTLHAINDTNETKFTAEENVNERAGDHDNAKRPSRYICAGSTTDVQTHLDSIIDIFLHGGISPQGGSGVNGKSGLVVDGQVWGPLDTGIEEPLKKKKYKQFSLKRTSNTSN